MKRSLPIFGVTLFSIAILLNSYIATYAQDFDFNRAFQDYTYNYNLYRSAHLEYISAKSEYLTYKTLTAQTKALEKTKNMLLNRAETLKTYLTALRMKLKETTGILNYQQNIYYLKLDNEVSWLATHKNSLPSAGTLEDLVKISQEAENRYPSIEILAYQTLGQVLLGKENSLREKINEQISKTQDKINQIKETGEDTTILERWLIQAKEKIKRSEEKEKEGQDLLSGLKPTDTSKQESWNKAQKAFEEENQYLKEAVSFLKEIIREIKSE
ncbi:MAG: hypothetical protein ACOZBZ_03535 [Patescibacteria group bacterium]